MCKTYGNDLGPNERESSLCHYGPPSQETTFGALNAIELIEGTRMFPVTETNAIVIRSAT